MAQRRARLSRRRRQLLGWPNGVHPWFDEWKHWQEMRASRAVNVADFMTPEMLDGMADCAPAIEAAYRKLHP